MFMGTLYGPYLEKLIGSTLAGFPNLVIAGERIENCLKNGKIQNAAGSSIGARKSFSGFTKKKEGEANKSSVTKGKGKEYQASYQQVVPVTPNLYQQQPFVVPA